MMITWKHRDTDLPQKRSIEQRVEVFYEQTLGWQLHIADLLANGGTGEQGNRDGDAVASIRHGGFAVLHICLSYFEFVGSLVSSKARGSRNKFEAGFRDVFPSLVDGSPASASFLKRLFEGARSGLYHEGRPRPGVGLGFPPNGEAIAYDSRTICISPERLPKVLKLHLEGLRTRLLDQTQRDLRARFVKRFDSGFGGTSH